jgi:hypothetical protein
LQQHRLTRSRRRGQAGPRVASQAQPKVSSPAAGVERLRRPRLQQLTSNEAALFFLLIEAPMTGV